MADYEIFELEAVSLQAGLTLRQAKLAYKTYGQLNAARDNVIVMPTFYGGQHTENEALMAAGLLSTPRNTSSSCPTCLGTVCHLRRATLLPRLTGPLSPHHPV